MIARREPIEEILRSICVEAERLLLGGAFTIVSVAPSGRLQSLAAPSFPMAYREALNEVVVGPDVGSCGTAIYRNSMVVSEDIARDPKWASFRSLALPLGWKSCTSTPMRDAEGRAFGAVALYLKEPRLPTLTEFDIVAASVGLCELAIRSQQRTNDTERRATIDYLTDLPNRSAFDEALSCLRCDTPAAWGLLIIDLDNLKVTNDTFGHEIGDALLRAVAGRISTTLAPDTTFRTGGDEFAAIIQDKDALQDLHGTAAAVLAALEEPVRHSGHTLIPRATIGGAILAPEDHQPQFVRRNADFALYHAKETVRGGFVRYWPGIGSRMANRRNSVREVAEGLRNFRIDAHYQPILRLDTREIVGFEALSRMTNEKGKLLPASLFQEAFSDAQVASEITGRMLALVSADIRSWLDQGLPVQHVGLNVTSTDFYAGDLSEKLAAAFEARCVPLRHLVVEVTENVYIGQRDRVVADGIAALRAMGIRVALDDFGTGFAALTHLLTVPVDVIKIDQSFVRRLAPGDPSMAIVKGLVQISTDIGLNVVAEGVETPDKVEALLSMGCRLGQGFVFSRAVPRSAAAELLRVHGQGMPDVKPMEFVTRKADTVRTITPSTRESAA